MRIAKILIRTAAIFVFITILSAAGASAKVKYLPDVTEEMTDPAFWTADIDNSDEILADADAIRAVNAAIVSADECNMTDLQTPA